MKKIQTIYKAGSYDVEFLKDEKSGEWSWVLSYKGDCIAASFDDLYYSLSNAKRGFKAAQKAMGKFVV